MAMTGTEVPAGEAPTGGGAGVLKAMAATLLTAWVVPLDWAVAMVSIRYWALASARTYKGGSCFGKTLSVLRRD